MGFEALHGIIDCLWIVGEPIFKFKEAVESETGILIEIGSYDWITNLSISDDIRAHDRYDNNKLSENCS